MQGADPGAGLARGVVLKDGAAGGDRRDMGNAMGDGAGRGPDGVDARCLKAFNGFEAVCTAMRPSGHVPLRQARTMVLSLFSCSKEVHPSASRHLS